MRIETKWLFDFIVRLQTQREYKGKDSLISSISEWRQFQHYSLGMRLVLGPLLKMWALA